MGIGGLRKSQNIQNSLTIKQNELNSYSAELGVDAAKKAAAAYDVEASALREQAELAYFQNRQEQEIYQHEADQIAANQEHDYLKSGVFIVGSPLAVVSQTRRLAQYKRDIMEQQGQLFMKLYGDKADLLHRQGLSIVQAAQAQRDLTGRMNQINWQENLLQQEQQNVAQNNARKQAIGNIAGSALNFGLRSGLSNKLISGGLNILKGLL
jgi:hypothetical protein